MQRLFLDILDDLAAVHDDEVAALQAEIALLKNELAASSGPDATNACSNAGHNPSAGEGVFVVDDRKLGMPTISPQLLRNGSACSTSSPPTQSPRERPSRDNAYVPDMSADLVADVPDSRDNADVPDVSADLVAEVVADLFPGVADVPDVTKRTNPRWVPKAQRSMVFEESHNYAEENLAYVLQPSTVERIRQATLGLGGIPFEPSSFRYRLAVFLETPKFELTVGLLIMLNTISMAVEMQYLGHCAAFEVKYEGFAQRCEKQWPNAAETFVLTERIFIVIFTAELLVRIWAIGLRLFKVPLNWLDIIVVVAGLFDWLAQSSNSVDPKMARLLRLAKVARGIRVLRVSKSLDSLNLLLKSIAVSMTTLFWSLCVLCVVQCIAGMVMSQLVRGYLLNDENPIQARQDVYAYYGTFTRSMITMFEVTLANWAPACRVLINNVGEEYGFCILAYRAIIGFAVLNVVGAVFIQQTTKVAQQDHDIMITEKMRATENYKKKLTALFNTLDMSGDGKLTKKEFVCVLENPAINAWLSSLGLDVHDIEGLFDLMVGEDEEISVDDFITGASKIRGQAKSVDIAQLRNICRTLDSDVHVIGNKLDVAAVQQNYLAETVASMKADFVTFNDDVRTRRQVHAEKPKTYNDDSRTIPVKRSETHGGSNASTTARHHGQSGSLSSWWHHWHHDVSMTSLEGTTPIPTPTVSTDQALERPPLQLEL